MTAAAVGPLAPRGLPGLLWHHGREQGMIPVPSLFLPPFLHFGAWADPSPVLPSPHPFPAVPVSSQPPGAAAPQPEPAAPTLCPLSALPSPLPALHRLWGAGPCSARADSNSSSKQRKITVRWAGLCCRSQALRGLGHRFFRRASPASLMPPRPQQTARLLRPAWVSGQCGPRCTREGCAEGAAAGPLFTAGAAGAQPRPASPVPSAGCVCGTGTRSGPGGAE